MLKNKDLEQAFKGVIYLEMDLIYNPVSLTRLPPNFFVPKVKGGQPEESQITIKCFRIFTATEKIVFWNLAKKKSVLDSLILILLAQ